MTTGTNERVDEFKNTIHIMTSNVGAGEMDDTTTLGFKGEEWTVTDKKLEDIARAAARRKFSPEFLNRLDQIVMFKTLTKTDIGFILGLMLQKVQNRVVPVDNEALFKINVTERGLKQLLEDGYDRRYNARHLRRAVEKYVAQPIARLVATGQIDHGDIVICDFVGDWKYAATSKKDFAGGVQTG